MKKYILSLVTAVCLVISPALNAKPNTRVIMKTSMGTIHIELFDSKAPVTVQNFLRYVDSGFYNGTIFHRVIGNFMIQGGGFTPAMQQKRTAPPIINEAKNGLSNKRGTLAMARTRDINSATAQFFINVVDNPFLDHGSRDYGYCVFGRVVKGMNIVDRIRAVRTGNVGHFQNVPLKAITIISVRRAGK